MMTWLRYLPPLFDATTLGICIYALIRGGAPERIGVAINVIATLISGMLVYHHYAAPEHAILGVDLCVLASFFVLALRSNRFWPLWSFGFAVADIAVHLARPLLPHIAPLAYEIAAVLWSYLAMVALALGTRFEVPRERARPARG